MGNEQTRSPLAGLERARHRGCGVGFDDWVNRARTLRAPLARIALDPPGAPRQNGRVRTLGVFAVLLSLASSVVVAALEPASILSPRPTGWVVDLARVLSPDDVAEINRVCDAVHAREGAELVVVTVPTTAGGEHRRFATRLFNHWGLGDRSRHNGLLIFVAVDDRAAEIVLGDGIDGDAEVAMSDRIMHEELVPRFRRGEHAAGLVAAARACARDFFQLPLASALPPDPATVPVESAVQRAPSQRTGVVPTRPARRRSDGGGGVPMPLVVVGLGGVGIAGALGLRTWLRKRPRRCARCSMTMSFLEEAADDAHLSGSERAEERLGSVDYDVWLCPGCGGIDKVRYGRWFTRYSRCDACGAVTTSKATKTLIHATTSSGGLVEIHELCQHCGRQHTYTRTTPRRSSSSSSSSGRSSSGFRGGRSSGRGSSGRW